MNYGFFIAYVFVLVSVIYIVSRWSNNKNNDRENENKQCIRGSLKKEEGIFYGGCLDIWHVSHFVMWFIIGILVPHKYIEVLIISIIWEYYEHYCFKYKVQLCTSEYCGRYEDIVLNVSGYIIGSHFSKLIHTYIPLLSKNI